ncbi:hypothetical protein JYT26_00710 [Beggiatoa alba]|nr:hypothetical protein [Beggiatoa alba]
MLILMAGSAQFFNRITEDTITSGALRDSTSSLMLAETAMENLRGQFINALDTVVEAPTDALDNIVAGQLTANMANPDPVLFTYMYYVSAGAGLDQTQPTILQKIANGESVNTATAGLPARSITSATTQLRINDLFASPSGMPVAPMLYTLNAGTGLLTASVAADWNTEVSASDLYGFCAAVPPAVALISKQAKRTATTLSPHQAASRSMAVCYGILSII